MAIFNSFLYVYQRASKGKLRFETVGLWGVEL
jgi:hypothetical protein